MTTELHPLVEKLRVRTESMITLELQAEGMLATSGADERYARIRSLARIAGKEYIEALDNVNAALVGLSSIEKSKAKLMGALCTDINAAKPGEPHALMVILRAKLDALFDTDASYREEMGGHGAAFDRWHDRLLAAHDEFKTAFNIVDFRLHALEFALEKDHER